tara:strand:+ start:348 stop:527 length:180 start_codon:yes stop_codon:yes gene_type:complete
MGLKSILKKISCKIFFCVGSKCSYNDEGKGKLRLDLDEEDKKNMFDNINEVVEVREVKE